ncbi:hypothetical protein FF38_04116 [Lucilia cuprina]|uniref:ascorbate ferrireductase (transmembrane) n=1 Tax=Lucilia cuprina TaxID=7375 RepID=A0A0L0BRW8_LUCCU|nr:hypothetical protein CVS40_7388 [Lucilia cuprina]KNC22787.1 hypothetical protein FF38_04116 [Lucilia cuprina]
MSCNNYDVFNTISVDNFILKSQEDVFYSSPIHSSQNLRHSLIFGMNLFNHIIIVVLTLAMAYKCWLLEFKKTALHAHLCTMGFVLLMAEGMMVRYPGNLLLNQYMSSSTKNLIHGLLQFVGGSLGIGGTLQKYWGKEIHFKSIHAKLGLAACILCTINFVSGLVSLFYPASLGSIRLMHGFLGLTTFITGMLCQFYGYETGFFNRNFSLKEKHLYKFFTIVILALTTIGPLKLFLFKLSKLMFNESL